MADNEQYLSLQVPERFYASIVSELARLVANERAAGDTAPAAQPDEAAADDGTTRPWTEADIRRLHRANGLNKTVKAILDLGSETPDEWVSFEDAKARAGVSKGSARAGLAGLTRHVKARYGRSNWPFKAAWQADGEIQDSQVHYKVSADVADAWKQAS